MLRLAIPVLAALLASCAPEQTPAEKAASDAAAVAEVEANQTPPPEAFIPQAIRYPDIEKYELFGAACSFVPEGGGLGAIAIAMADEGFLMRNGDLLRLAADKGSAQNPVGSWRKYDGRRVSFTLDLADGKGRQSGVETTDFNALLTIRDGKNDEIYKARGLAQCGS